MAWIESHQTLARHPKTRKLARLLDVGIPQAIGHLHCFWWWALDYAQDGELTTFDDADIADAAMWESDAQLFVRACVEVGFIDQSEEGLIIHDWQDYAGRLVEKRKANAQRMRDARAKHPSLLKGERATHVQRTYDARAGATVPNPTVPNSTEQTHTQEATADAAECAFQDFFAEFRETYPENADGKKPQMSRAMAAAKKVPVGDRPLVLLAVKHYAMSSSVQRGIVKYAQGFLNPTFWRDYLEEPTGGKGTNGKNQPKSKFATAADNVHRELYGTGLDEAYAGATGRADANHKAGYIPRLPQPPQDR